MTREVAHELMNDSNAAWSRAGAYALAEYLEEIERESATEMEMDVCAIRCDFCEYDSATLAARAYGNDYSASLYNDDDTENANQTEETEAHCLEWLQNRTQVIVFDGGRIRRGAIILQDF